ncbi:MAG: hypothetical protein AB7O96_07790 [Pseudobdellovibrionaceae bacterium]
MKTILVLLVTLLLPLTTFAAPVTLLDCHLNSWHVEWASISYYNGNLFLLTKPADGDFTSQIIDEKQWEYRIIAIANTPDLKGILYKKEGQWFFAFKDSSGWSSSGNASCSE